MVRPTNKETEAWIDDPEFSAWAEIRRELVRARASEARLLEALKALHSAIPGALDEVSACYDQIGLEGVMDATRDAIMAAEEGT